MNKINFKKEKIPFTQVANEVLNDKNLSFKAKGLYAYLYSKPDDWDFETNRISKQSKDGRDGVRSGIRELEQYGYLTRSKELTGRMVYKLNIKPMTEKPSQVENKPMTEKANDGKTHSGKSRHISNKDIKVIKSISNKDSEETSQGQLLNEFIEIMEPLNPVGYTKWFKNTTQRSNVKLLMEKFTPNQMRELLRFIELNQNKQFFPSISTPLQLVDKLPQIEKFYKSAGYKKKPNVIL